MRYIVEGSCMEYMAHVHVVAASQEEAIAKWEEAFPKESRKSYQPRAFEATGVLAATWRHEGYRYWSGGYVYHI